MQHPSWFISREYCEKKTLSAVCSTLLTKNGFLYISNNQLNHVALLIFTAKATKHLSIKEKHTHTHTVKYVIQSAGEKSFNNVK